MMFYAVSPQFPEKRKRITYAKAGGVANIKTEKAKLQIPSF